MSKEDMDSFVFCFAQRKTAIRLSKEMNDIMTFCPEKRSAQDKYGLPTTSPFYIMSEIPEVTSAMMSDSKLIAMLNKYPDGIDSIHFSDQYTGLKPPEDQAPAELPEGMKAMFHCAVAQIASFLLIFVKNG